MIAAARRGSAGGRAGRRAGPAARSPRATSRTAATGDVLTPVELALGEGPVVVARPVHQQHRFPGRSTTAPAASTSSVRVVATWSASLTPPRRPWRRCVGQRGTSAVVAVAVVAWCSRWRSWSACRWWRRLAARPTSSRRWPSAPAGTRARSRGPTGPASARELGVDLDADVVRRRRRSRTFLDEGYDADLTSASALVQSAPVLQDAASASRPPPPTWELFSQSHGRRGDHPAAARRHRLRRDRRPPARPSASRGPRPTTGSGTAWAGPAVGDRRRT